MSIQRLILHSLIVMILIAGCMPSQNGGGTRASKKSTSSSVTKPDAGDPTFSSSANYIQNGSLTSFTSITVAPTFTDGFYLRGEAIHNYIKNRSPTTVHCILSRYVGSTNEMLLLAARPKSIYNMTTLQREYYYFVETAEASNLSFCNKPSLVSALSNLAPGETFAFTPNKVCASCATTILSGQTFHLFNTSGIDVTEVDLAALSLRINLGASTSTNTTISCSSASECNARGYDCCGEGHCINNKTTKSNVDVTNAEYLQSIQDIAENSSRIYNYPQFYNLCPVSVITTPTPVPTVNEPANANDRFIHLKELYECTTRLQGEMSICTLTLKNSGTTGTFDTYNDDRNFNSTYHGDPISLINDHSIYEISHAGEVLYNATNLYSSSDKNACPDSECSISGENDSVVTGSRVTVSYNHTPRTNAPNNDLKIRYRIDGSCQKINSALAKCTKYFVQGQELGQVDDHINGLADANANKFFIPEYADVTKLITVKVDDVVRLEGATGHWTKTQGVSPDGSSTLYYVAFNDGNRVTNTQKVQISYYVNLLTYPNLMTAKAAAQKEINQLCISSSSTSETLDSYLTAVTSTDSGSSTVVEYKCAFASPLLSEPPLEQTVLLSSKSVPHRFFDGDVGAYYSEITRETPAQEGSKFEYTDNDKLKPNNLDGTGYIGFNEIYGSFTRSLTTAKPAKEVRVVKGKTYDIWIDRNTVFSSCSLCGSDYYSQVAKIFPRNFQYNGGGYFPDKTTTDRFRAPTYRADDLIFGRACFVPATMIPWTHKQYDTVMEQRPSRLSAQHMLFANGYNRDWYGFDYGSIIGSFDGVKWFSIGNQRRIKAATNRLFLAVNAYFGDMTQESTYQLRVQDASLAPNSGSFITSDYLSDGAQCQQQHVCSSDKDCVARLGWDYTCADVNLIKTEWPLFDDLAAERPDTTITNMQTLYNMFGASPGGSKRCVYRGSGAICHATHSTMTANSHYTRTLPSADLSLCSANNYCAPLTDSTFNTKITRFGVNAVTVNSRVGDSSYPNLTEESDTFGLGTRILGRPYDYNGTGSVDASIITHLTSNYVSSICIPGKDANIALGSSFETAQGSASTNLDSFERGDKVLGIGMTLTGDTAADNYVTSCPTFDDNGNLIHFADSTTASNDPTLVLLAAGQNIPTNSLSIFTTATDNPISNVLKFFNYTLDTNSYVSEFNLQANRCMRAPNATCFTDLDCAPSSPISLLFSGLDESSYSTYTSSYEVKFWQDELVCSQSIKKTDPTYDAKNNRCCRGTGKTYTIATDFNSGAIVDTSSAPGTDTDLDAVSRYSLTSIIYPEVGGGDLNGLAAPLSNIGVPSNITPSTTHPYFETFSKMADRVCCSGDWIRNFDVSNQGGHTWGPSKMQRIDKTQLRCYNWFQGDNNFTCKDIDPQDPACAIKQLSDTEETTLLNWLSSLELTGIPQVAILPGNDADIMCSVSASDQNVAGTRAMDLTVKTTVESAAELTDGTKNYFSAKYSDNFDSNIKTVFSENEITCCKPLNTILEDTEPASTCCTGTVDTNARCCLPDYTDLSLYYNRYISSGAKGIREDLFDPNTGYLKDASMVWTLAMAQSACCSGNAVQGLAVYNFKIPGHESDADVARRFVDGKGAIFQGIDSLFDNGLRWNNHVYCVPKSFKAPGS